MILNELYARYQIPMMVVENGLGAIDVVEDDHTIHDSYRIDYLRERVKQMKEAIKDGVDVIAYTPWGSLDRWCKDSFYLYKKVIASNGEELD